MNVQIDTPYLTPDEYARRSGMTPRQVLERCKNGDLPVRKRNNERERYFVNNALLTKEALDAKY